MADNPRKQEGRPLKRHVAQCIRSEGPALAVLLLVCLALFAGYLADPAGRMPGIPTGDARTQWLPWRAFGFAQMRAGDLPFWNPHVLCGTPFLASWQSALLYPPNGLFMAMPVDHAARVTLFLHVFFGAAAAYALARYMKIGRFGATAAGLVFALAAPQLLRVYAGHWGAVCALPWMPLVILAVEALIRRPTVGRAMLGGAAVALQLLAGAPQYAAYTWLLAIVYAALRLLLGGAPRTNLSVRALCDEGKPERAEQHGQTSLSAAHVVRVLLFGIVMAAFGVMLAAPQVVPALAATPFCARATGVREAWSTTFYFPTDNLVTLLAPRFYGDDVGAPYRGFFNYWEMCAYVGAVTLVLAAAGLAFARRRLRWALGAAAVVMLLLAFGRALPPLHAVYRTLPGVGMLRGTSKFLAPFSLMLALLAGLGVDALPRARSRWAWALPVACGAVAAALYLAMSPVSANWVERVATMADRAEYRGLRTWTEQTFRDSLAVTLSSLASGAARWCAAGLIAAACLAAARRTHAAAPQRAHVLRGALVGLLLIDLLCFGWRYVRPERGFAVPPERMAALRAADEIAGPADRVWLRGGRGLNDPMLVGAHGVEGIEPNPPAGFHLLFVRAVRRPADIAPSIYQILRPSPVWDAMGLSIIAQPAALADRAPHWQPVATAGDTALFRNPRALGRARIVHAAGVAPFDPAAAEAPDYARFVWLDRAPTAPPAPGQGTAERDAAAIVEDTPDRVVIDATLKGDGWLVLTDNWFPGWRATSNGRPVPIHRANIAFRALRLGAGRHRIVFTHTPDGWRTGLALCALALCLALALVVRWSVSRVRS